MGYLDVIGIGAVNYDYIFFCQKIEYKNRCLPEFGQEYLNGSREALYEDMSRMLYTTDHTIQVGGSSLFALRTVHAIDPEMRLGYVGVCGTPTKMEINAGFDPECKNEFSFLYDKSWLFFDEEPPGVSLVRLFRGTRSSIDIDAGANDKLAELIRYKENVEGADCFVNYLSHAKWIHVSSLADFSSFLFLVERIKKAKERNPLLKISFDPGFEYTKSHKTELKEMFGISDYIFLNQNEISNLTGNAALPEKNQIQVLSSLFNACGMSNTQVLVIKDTMNHVLMNYRNGTVQKATFWHSKLCSAKIKNDTGAGDAFAGGFIASLLSKQLLLHQPFPILIGAKSAAVRMQCKEVPFEDIRNMAKDYIDQVGREESLNYKQRFKRHIKDFKKQMPGFISGIITGVLASLIAWFIQILVQNM